MKFGPRHGWLLAFWLGGIVCLSPLAAQESPPAPAVAAVKPEAAQPASAAGEVEKNKLSSSGPALSAELARIFGGGSPGGVADLKAMEKHVQSLRDRLLAATVGVQVGPAQGSGVIISPDGYVLTAAHVSGTPSRDVTFFFPDGKTRRGKTLGMNRSLDAGIMKISGGSNFPHVEMGDSAALREGQWCLATGHPGGYQPDRSPVLRMGRVLLIDSQAITTDCTLVGGDSGGPLFDMMGRVIGINSRIAQPLASNMHVPVVEYKTSWDRMVKGEAWGHYLGQEPFLGVRGEADAKAAKLTTVFPDSPAEKAGLKTGDVILQFDGKDVPDFPALTEMVKNKQPGDNVRIRVQRGEEVVNLRLVIGKRGG